MTSYTDDGELFRRLRDEIDREISDYVYDVPIESIGTPWSGEKVAEELREMRCLLVQPRWEEADIRLNLRDTSREHRRIRKCVLLGEDGRYVLIFDPIDELYHLGIRQEWGISTWGINGRAVDCFLAR